MFFIEDAMRRSLPPYVLHPGEVGGLKAIYHLFQQFHFPSVLFARKCGNGVRQERGGRANISEQKRSCRAPRTRRKVKNATCFYRGISKMSVFLCLWFRFGSKRGPEHPSFLDETMPVFSCSYSVF